MHGRQRTVVPRIARLQHVERFATPNLADDEPIRSHSQRGAHEIAHAHGTRALRVRRARFQADDVRLLQPQLRGLFDRHDPLGRIEGARQRVATRRLAGAGRARDHDVPSRSRHRDKERLRGLVDTECVQGNGPRGEAPNRHARPVGREGRQHRVQTRAVREPRIDHW